MQIVFMGQCQVGYIAHREFTATIIARWYDIGAF